MKHENKSPEAPLDLSKWKNVPFILMGVGGVLALIGLLFEPTRKALCYSWLTAFMFYLSLGLGALFLVIAHHLFDAGWSVPIRRFCEHIANLMVPWMLILFVPIYFARHSIFPWLNDLGHPDHSLHAKFPLFTEAGFLVSALACFAVWWVLSYRLRYWSLEQDKTGDAKPTHRMRFLSGLGVFLYAVTLTLASFMWMKSLMYEWFSTMYGVTYFAGSAWLMLATAYMITMILDRKGVLTDVLHDHQYYFLGSIMFAFTVFYAYVNFAQYFIIWNANMPEETFWYYLREKGSWFAVSMVIIFGHFFLPFLALLRIDVKSVFKWMVPLCVWAWLMHWVDMSFQIMPAPYPNGYPFQFFWLHIGCWAFMGGFLTWRFLKEYAKHPPYPIKDPRLIEAMGHYHPVPTQLSGGELDEVDDLRDAPPQFGGTNR